MPTRPEKGIVERCERSVSEWPGTALPLASEKACDQAFRGVGMPGFEPGISGPPDQRPGPNWATSRVVHWGA